MSSENIELNAQKRTVTGKHFKKFRQQGWVPAVFYGPNREPVKLQIAARELAIVLAEAGGSQLIDLKVEGETHPALIREVQRDSVRDILLHVDLYAVSMDRKIRTEVPIEHINEVPLVEEHEAVLVVGATTLEVECLPGNLPATLPVDLSVLVDFDTVINVSDLTMPEGVIILNDPDEMIATLTRLAAEEEEEEEFFDAEAVEVIGRGKAEEGFDEE
ncbi:MAG: 50S ribosomal protein L25 [Anaerolineae bacterium]|nr:50S ribosomal protein L25 [Anaerolineae bacterium]